MFVAFARAVGSHEPHLSRACQDPSAEALSGGLFRTLLASAARRGPEATAYSWYRAASGGLVDHVAVRTAVIDDAVRTAVAGGARQLVVLGAGFDGRAHRMAELADVVVFEVDHPSTQRLKQHKAKNLPVRAREIRYAACDFERVSLADALASVRFDQCAESVWIWEGVTMYLPADAISHTLDVTSRMSAPGSHLITTYLTPELTQRGGWVGRVGARSLGTLSEPIRFTTTPEHMHELLEARCLSPLSDVMPSAVASRYGAELSRLAFLRPSERVVVSVRLGLSSP
jgi:methyltransferase (TIGR00027 family)